jgi:prefoldin subunit 5
MSLLKQRIESVCQSPFGQERIGFETGVEAKQLVESAIKNLEAKINKIITETGCINKFTHPNPEQAIKNNNDRISALKKLIEQQEAKLANMQKSA